MTQPMTVDELRGATGRDLGFSEWFTVDQERVNQFADVTLDHQYIHIDPDRAAQTPFGGTIAHGFLTMSLMVHLAEGVAVTVENQVMGINYGFDKLRFVSPVPVGSNVRGRFVLKKADTAKDGEVTLTYGVTVEIEGQDRPALAADWIARQFFH